MNRREKKTLLKCILVLTLLSSLCFAPQIHAQGYRLNPNFNATNLTAEQQELIDHKFEELTNAGKGQTETYISLNLYAYSLLSEDQIALYDISWRSEVANIYRYRYEYLQIADDQINRMIDMQESMEKADSLKVVHVYFTLPVDSLLQLLDSVQLSLEAEHQKEQLAKRRAAIAYADSQKVDDAAFEEFRSTLAKTYHAEYLSEAKRLVLDQIRKISDADANRADRLAQIYQARVELDKRREISECYSEDSILIAPNTKILKEHRYERFAYLPDLCVYWCRFGASDTGATQAEEEEILTGLEYLKMTYSDIIINALDQFSTRREKIRMKVEEARPKRKGTNVNIVAEERVKVLEGIAELILTK